MTTGITSVSIVLWCQYTVPIAAPNAGVFFLASDYGISITGGAYEYASSGVVGSSSNSPISGSFVQNTNYMLALSWNGSTITTYTNGVNISQNTTAKSGSLSNNSTMYIGRRTNAASSFGGYIQHVSLFNTALTKSQIQNLYVIGNTGTYPVTGAAQANVYPWSVTILAANSSRKRVTITNDSDAIIYLALGTTAAGYTGIKIYPFGGQFITQVYTGAISAIHNWTIGVKSVSIEEET
jgi:hypothetical protein